MFGRKGRNIPVGKDGHVPVREIVRRYHEIGEATDSDSDDDIILPLELTPEQIAEWWEDPSVCDIQGIDTKDSGIYSVPFSIRGRKRKALKRIAILSDRKEADRIKKILAESFTAEELERMSQGRSLMVSVEPYLKGCTGYYLRRQDGVPVPEIVLEHGTTTDGIVHEAVHHLRVADGRTSFPTEDGVLGKGYRRLSKKEKDEIVRREESQTVAETVARTNIDPKESGYYCSIPGKDSRSAYLHDQKVISGSRALKGKAAIKAAQENYDRSSISRAIISSNRRKR